MVADLAHCPVQGPRARRMACEANEAVAAVRLGLHCHFVPDHRSHRNLAELS